MRLNAYPLMNSVKYQRDLHSWTQEQVAQKIGVTRKTICSIERGKIIPSTLTALKLAALFETRLESIFYITDIHKH